MKLRSISHTNVNQSTKVVFGKAEIVIDGLTKDDLFVYSKKSLFYLSYKKDIIAKKICFSDYNIDKKWIDEYILKNNVSRIISLGNGKVTDVAKYIADCKNIQLISIPSILSNNVYFTDKSCLVENDKKSTYQTKIPEVLIYDEDFLLKSDFQFHFYGLMDIICMYVSLMDWKLASIVNDEEIDEVIYSDCEKLLNELTNNKTLILRKNKKSLKIIFDLLNETGNIVCKYGSGRPVSGSEHVFSNGIEQEIEIYHGESVALGILLLSSFSRSNKVTSLLFEFINEVGILKNIKDNIPKGVVLKILENIEPKENRFTVLNIICPIHSERAKDLVDKIYA